MRFAYSICLSLLMPSFLWAQNTPNDMEVARKAVVHINTTSFRYSYKNPWQQPSLSRSGGTGFIIEGNRILTNAHVVSSANRLRVQRPNQRTDYPARVLHIAHDCDLAMLVVDDPAFFEGAEPLEIGETPQLNSPLVVVGFPIGGKRVSITRGVVSRLGMDVYSHSKVDYHLTIQVDAAINPGNSGGPGLQNGKVIGVAFQVLTRGENLGYLIPPPVVRKFLTDVEDGRYDGYIDFGALDSATENPVVRKALGLPGRDDIRSPDTGVYIYNVLPGTSADGFLKAGDLLLSINGVPISENGDVEIDGNLHVYSELIDNLSPGTTIETKVLRDGKIMLVSFPARRTSLFDFQRLNHDTPPPYFTTGGLVFQPLDANLMEAYRSTWSNQKRVELLYRYRYYLYHGLYEDSSVDVVLTKRLSDPVNLYADSFLFRTVEKVNGEKVSGLSHFAELVDRAVASERYVVLHFRSEAAPLALRSADLLEAAPRVLENYRIEADRFPNNKGEEKGQ